MNIQDANIAGMAYRCRADAALSFEYVDGSSKQIVGYNEAELVETGIISLPDLIQPSIRDDVRRLIQEGISRRGTFTIPVILFTKDRTPADGILIGKGNFTSPLTLSTIEGYILRIQEGAFTKTPEPILGQVPGDLWQRMLDHTEDIIAYIGFDSTINYITPSVTRILGYPVGQVLGKPFTTLLNHNEKNRFENMCDRANEPELGKSTRFLAAKADGDPILIAIRIFSSTDMEGNFILSASLAYDEKTPAIPIEDTYQTDCDSAFVPLIITGRSDRRILSANRPFMYLTGKFQPEEILGLTLTAAGLLTTSDDLLSLESNADKDGAYEAKETTLRTTEGTVQVLLSARIYMTNGQEALAWSVVPLPDQKQVISPQITASDSEISHNLYHRFKNDLLSLESIMRIKGMKAEPCVNTAIKENRAFLFAVSAFYQKISGSAGSTMIPVYEYLNMIVANLSDEFADQMNNIAISLRCEEKWEFGISSGIPLGIITTELIINSVTHAFEPGSSGQIEISLTREEGWFILQIVDSGKGLPEALIHEEPTSAGLSIVTNLSLQLSGTASFSNEDGARVRIIFPEPLL
jgi:PAS domain S-box-containing protein